MVDSVTSLRTLSPSLAVFELQSLTISFALSTICFLLLALTSSIPERENLALQGPTLSTLSTAAAMRAAVPMSVDMGTITSPLVLSFFDSRLISILPTFQLF